MGRELKRKEAKKNKKQNNNTNVELDTKISLITLLKLVFFIILFLLVIYYVLAVFVTKEIDISNKNATSNTEETSGTTNNTVSDKILASNIFNQKEEVYYVYFYDFKTQEEDDLSSLISGSIEEKLYKVDTNSGLNSKYVTTESGNKNATKLDELKVKSNTLIKIENDKIKEYHEGKNDIMASLKD